MAVTLVLGVFESILATAYIPALVVLFFVTLYYLSPVLGRVYLSNLSQGGVSNKFEAVLYVLFVLFWLVLIFIQLAI